MLRLRFTVEGEERVVPLARDLRLGRGADCDLVLPDSSVSRHHADIRRAAGGWAVEDAGSTNGVHVNHVPVRRAPLHPGDRVTVGSFELLVEGEEDALANATIVRPLGDREKRQALEQAYDNKIFGYLTRLARLLLTADAVDEVLERVLDLAFEALPVDRGFILLRDEAGEPVCELARSKGRTEFRPQGEVPVSRTMLQAVMSERVALVTYDALSDERLLGGESIRIHQIRAAMCAPLWSEERIIGVVQVDSPYQVGVFTERDLDLLTALANYAAVAIERLRFAQRAEFERQVRGRLERYHSPAVIEEVLRAGEEGSRRLRVAQATVLFADLAGFTSFAERQPPEAVADLLDAYFNLAVEAIFAAGGTLDKFIGDCVMAFFGAPVPQADHAVRAARAALQLQRSLAEWNAERSLLGEPPLLARVGLNSGPVVVGDIGSSRRVDYTVLGNTVNVAARLEASVARPGDVVLGAETHRLLAGAFPSEPLGELQLRGLQQPVTAYRLI